MIIKTFSASTVASALKQIRAEMGGDAIILKTRVCPAEETIFTGHKFEVTACIDEAVVGRKVSLEESQSGKPAGQFAGAKKTGGSNLTRLDKTLGQILSNHRTPDLMKDIDPRVQSVLVNLLDSDVPPEIARRISGKVAGRLGKSEKAEQVALEEVKNELTGLTRGEVKIQNGAKVAFIGPSGAGKTSVMGKAAAQLCSKFGQKIKLMSLDNMKVSAYEEIGAYAELLNLSTEMFDETKKRTKDDAILLIDTPPIGRDRERQSKLFEKLKIVQPDILFFVFSASARSNDLIDAANIFESFSPKFSVMTHLDETGRWGGIFTIGEYLNTPIAFVTDSPGGIGQMKLPDVSRMARQILRIEESGYDQ